jgi:hypothetical protein
MVCLCSTYFDTFYVSAFVSRSSAPDAACSKSPMSLLLVSDSLLNGPFVGIRCPSRILHESFELETMGVDSAGKKGDGQLKEGLAQQSFDDMMLLSHCVLD